MDNRRIGYSLSGINDESTQQQVISLLQEIRAALPPDQREKVDSALDALSEAIIKDKIQRESTGIQNWLDANSWAIWVFGAYLGYRFLFK